MSSKTAIIAAAVGSLVALANCALAVADDQNLERCYGVAKAGKNDCTAGRHACGGQSAKDGDRREWINVPKGTCERLVGGSLSAKK